MAANAPTARSSDLKRPQSGWLVDLSVARVLPAQERPHEEICLFGPVGVFRPDRARPASPASFGHAIPARRASKVTHASGDVVARLRERSNRTGLQAPASRTRFTWVRSE